MNQQELTLMAIRGLISTQPEELRQQVKEAEGEIRAVLEKYQEAGTLALVLLAAEKQVEYV